VLSASHRGAAIEVDAYRAAPVPVEAGVRYRFAVVPGYTPYVGWREGLHPEAERRLELGLRALADGLASLLILSGGAVHSPDNEAILMYEWLTAHGVSPSRLILEPHARHTTTNLKYAGGIVLRAGESQALVLTSDDSGWRRIRTQAFYLGRPTLSSFHVQCLWQLGHLVGELTWLRRHQILFKPSKRCLS